MLLKWTDTWFNGHIFSVFYHRFTVRQLLDHEFFAEGDVKVEVMPETAEQIDNIMFRMEVPNRENRKNGQESIEFSYNLETDVPENVVDEMVSSLFHISISNSCIYLFNYLSILYSYPSIY